MTRPFGTCQDCGATLWWTARGIEATHRSTCKMPLPKGQDRLPVPAAPVAETRTEEEPDGR